MPQLGSPLPGDLGRPILDHQRSLGIATAPSSPDQAAQAVEAERQRIAAERKAARESGVMMQVPGANRTAPAVAADVTTSPPAFSVGPAGAKLALDLDRDPNSQQRKADFLASGNDDGDINPHALTAGVAVDAERGQRNRRQFDHGARF